MTRAQIIGTRSVERTYGVYLIQAIIDHPVHGRLLIQEGFNGNPIGAPNARWRCGIAAKLRNNDTFETLDELLPDYTIAEAFVLRGYDKDRPVLALSGRAIADIAEDLGI